MTAAKWKSGRQMEVLASLQRKHRHLGARHEKLLQAYRKTAALKKVMVRGALLRIAEMLDRFYEEVREDASMGGIVDAMATILSESDLASILTRNSLKVKRRTDALAQVQSQIEQCRWHVQGMCEKGNAKLSSWYLQQLTDLEHRLWSCELLVSK